MDYLTLIGNSCFTAAEAKKLQAAIKGPAIQEIRGFWIHYVHLNHSDRASQQVREELKLERGNADDLPEYSRESGTASPLFTHFRGHLEKSRISDADLLHYTP
jgi:phosphoribosylformylglycinamidine synthase